MAEKPEDKDAIDEFADELDSMLDASTSDEQNEEIIDDEDAIDRLLMDNAFGAAPEEKNQDEFAEIDELISENIEQNDALPQDDVIDEFADDEDDLVVEEDQQQAFDAEQAEDDKFDEFTDVEPVVQRSLENEVVSEDYDISVGDEDDDDIEPVVDAVMPDHGQPEEIPDYSGAFEAINRQLSALQTSQSNCEQKISQIEEKPDSSVSVGEDVESLKSDIKKQQRKLTALEDKKPVQSIIALVIGVIALLIGSVLGFFGMQANSKVKGLNEVIIELEEDIELFQANGDDKAELKKFSKQILALQDANKMLTARMGDVQEKFSSLAEKEEVPSDIEARLQQISDQQVQSADALETLQLQLIEVEKTALKSVKTKKSVFKKKWQVNLVAFRQEWYATRKAQEFERQGVPVEVYKLKSQGKDWYRLRVKGFASKYEAAAYASKVKKLLNLTSVWVDEQ